MIRVSVVSEQLLPAELAAAALRSERALEVTTVVGGASGLEGPPGARAMKAAVILFAALVPPETGLLPRITAGAGPTAANRRSVVVADLCGCIGMGRAIQLGARGYVGAWERPEVLARRVLEVGEGRLAVPPGSLDGLRRPLGVLGREAMGMNRLSEAELELLRAVARGDTPREIGERLNLTAAEVRGRLRRIMLHLGARNENELCAMAASAGLYEPRTPAAA